MTPLDRQSSTLPQSPRGTSASPPPVGTQQPARGLTHRHLTNPQRPRPYTSPAKTASLRWGLATTLNSPTPWEFLIVCFKIKGLLPKRATQCHHFLRNPGGDKNTLCRTGFYTKFPSWPESFEQL